jgi:hypothetical protein
VLGKGNQYLGDIFWQLADARVDRSTLGSSPTGVAAARRWEGTRRAVGECHRSGELIDLTNERADQRHYRRSPRLTAAESTRDVARRLVPALLARGTEDPRARENTCAAWLRGGDRHARESTQQYVPAGKATVEPHRQPSRAAA